MGTKEIKTLFLLTIPDTPGEWMLTSWLAKEGSEVKKGTPVVSIKHLKRDLELAIDARGEGKLNHLVEEGEVFKPGVVLGRVTQGEKLDVKPHRTKRSTVIPEPPLAYRADKQEPAQVKEFENIEANQKREAFGGDKEEKRQNTYPSEKDVRVKLYTEEDAKRELERESVQLRWRQTQLLSVTMLLMVLGCGHYFGSIEKDSMAWVSMVCFIGLGFFWIKCYFSKVG